MSGQFPLHRRLRIEPLENRQLLALVTVDTLADTVDFNDGVTSLREALFATNLVGGADTIDFAPSLTAAGPVTIALAQGELAITDDLSINGPGANLLTIDASGNDPTPDVNNGDGSRLFYINDGNSTANKSISISGLTLTGGDAGGSGGAIRSRENLSITGSTVHDNAGRHGAGVANVGSGVLSVTHSTISGNIAVGVGGGIFNSQFGRTTVAFSSIRGNSAVDGGGIDNHGDDLTIVGTTISGNTASERGGGIDNQGSAVQISGSTLSGNSAGQSGGGIFDLGSLLVSHSTITENSAGQGGGIFCFANYQFSPEPVSTAGGEIGGAHEPPGPTLLSHTILAGNVRGTSATPDDLFVYGTMWMEFSLLGVSNEMSVRDQGGSLIGTADAPIDPLLGPLAANGGPTFTHALLAGSPAIDSRDSSAAAGVGDVPEVDQRGAPFGRVFNGRIDMGAYEAQPILASILGDYNQDSTSDAADYVVWRKLLGTSVAPAFSGADGDGDSLIDLSDYDVWRENFGVAMPPGAGSGNQAASSGLFSRPSAMSSGPNADEERSADAVPGQTNPTRQTDLRIVDFGLRIGGVRVSGANSQEPKRVAIVEAARRDHGLLAWLAWTDQRRTRGVGNVSAVVIEDAEGDATDRAFDSLDATTDALAGVTSWRHRA